MKVGAVESIVACCIAMMQILNTWAKYPLAIHVDLILPKFAVTFTQPLQMWLVPVANKTGNIDH